MNSKFQLKPVSLSKFTLRPRQILEKLRESILILKFAKMNSLLLILHQQPSPTAKAQDFRHQKSMQICFPKHLSSVES